MEHETIVARLLDFFAREFPSPGARLTPETDLLENWLVDSFGIVNTTLFLESAFGIEVKRADINAANFRNVNSLARFVAGHLPPAAVP